MKRLLFLITLLASFNLSAQKVKINGYVKDSLNTPLSYANVMAIDTTSKSIPAFCVTNDEGFFSLAINGKISHKLTASFIGYKTFEKILTQEDITNSPLSIKLKNDATLLDAVEIVHELPVTINGDTITYKTEQFTQGNERKLEDVLEDLPGFEVDDDGEVKVQGKKVNKLTVDGKKFFDGDTKLAVQNLPANVVDKVQLLQNYNEISPLSSVNNSNDLALNIQLKEDKKNIVFGDVTAGGGLEDRYLAHANNFYYAPKTSINFIGNLNNIGNQPFTFHDYIMFNGGISSLIDQSGSGVELDANELGFPVGDKLSAMSLNSKLAALSANFNPNKKINFNVFSIVSETDNKTKSISSRNYINNTQDRENNDRKSEAKSSSRLVNFSSVYSPNRNLHISYHAFGKVINRDIENNMTSSTVQNQADFLEAKRNTSFDVTQQLRSFYSNNDKNIFSAEISYQYKHLKNPYNILSSQKIFPATITQENQDRYSLHQDKDIATNKQESKFSYYRVINRTNHFIFSAGNSTTWQNLRSSLKAEQDDVIPEESLAFQNSISNRIIDSFLGLSYKIKISSLTIQPSAYFHLFDTFLDQENSDLKFSKKLLLPSLFLKYDFRSTHNLTMRYALKNQFFDIQNTNDAFVLTSYNNLFEGRNDLENSIYHDINIDYSNFIAYNSLTINGNFSYQKKYSDLSNKVEFAGIETSSSVVNSPLPNENLNGYFRLEKSYKPITITVSASSNRSIQYNYIEDRLVKNTNFSFNHSTSIEYKPSNLFETEIGLEKTYDKYQSGLTNSFFTTTTPFANAKLTLKNIKLDVDYELFQYKNGDTKNFYDILDFSIRYQKEKSPWEFAIAGLNILNNSSVRRNSFDANFISTYEYFIQKRYVTFSIQYEL